MSATPRHPGLSSRSDYVARVETLLAELDIPATAFAHRNLPFFELPDQLVVVEVESSGKEHRLTPGAASAWRAMAAAARRDGIEMHIVSAFRDLERQADIIRRKQRLGVSLERILKGSAPPGYSEHHTGRAVDINTPGCRALEEDFERTDAFGWLTRHALAFGFSLSFPRDNAYGYIFEPWHWLYADPKSPAV